MSLDPRLVPSFRCAVDATGHVYLDNVDVGGVAPSGGVDPYFLAGLLNSPVVDFVFQRISKPFRGNSLSANKQFIAPLPIPNASADDRAEVAQRAQRLQVVHTKLRDTTFDLTHRLGAVPSQNRRIEFIFPSLSALRDRIADAPKNMDKIEQLDWAKRAYNQELEGYYEGISQRLHTDVELGAELDNGELRFLVDGVPIIETFVNDIEGPFILAQWKAVASIFGVTAKTTGKQLCGRLRKLAVTDNKALVDQVITAQHRIDHLEVDITVQEAEMNELAYRLYGLSKDEVRMVEKG